MLQGSATSIGRDASANSNTVENMLWGDDGATSSPPPLAGEGQGGGTQSDKASPSPTLQPKSDVSDFGRLTTRPSSGTPGFGCRRGREQTERAARILPKAAHVADMERRKRAPQPVPRSVDLLAWYDRHRRTLPWRAAPGEPRDPYRVWLSEIMLQQTTVKAV